MKNFALIGVLILALGAYAAIHFHLGSTRVLRIGSECDYPPNNWEEERDTDSNIPISNREGRFAEGYDIQIAKAVADSIGAKLEVYKLDWNELIPALNNKKIDAIFSSMLDTADRKKYISFSNVYEDRLAEYNVVVNRGEDFSHAVRITDFTGARFVGQHGTNSDSAINQIPGAEHLPPVDSQQEMMEKLKNKEVDGIILDVEVINMYQQTYPNMMAIKFPRGEGFNFGYTGVCAGVRKDDKKLLEEINNVLDGLSKRDRQRIMDRSIAREWDNF